MGGLESPPRCGEGSGQLGVPGARLFSEVPSDSTRGHGHKPKHGVVSLNIRKHFVLWGWQSVSTGCPMASPSLENFRSHLNNQVWVKLLELGGGGWTSWPLEVPSHLTCSAKSRRASLRSTRAEDPPWLKTSRIVLQFSKGFTVHCCCLWLYGGEGLLWQTLIAARRPPVESCLCLERASSRELYLIPPPFGSDVLSASNSRDPLLRGVISLC